MKANWTWKSLRWRAALWIFAWLAGTALLVGGKSAGKYTAHEWGTFTSIQGGDGVLLEWQPLENSPLPRFVYDYTRPGIHPQPTSILLSKSMPSLQRMETPVIYFYAGQEQRVDVTVDFPQGLITEWYPQASQWGPSTVAPSPTVAKLDHIVHQAGVPPSFTFQSWLRNRGFTESKVRWGKVHILPAAQPESVLPQDRSGSHYFAARDTDANLLRIDSLNPTNPAPEHEKFIFYRGVGSFATPLRVTMETEESLLLSNTGQETLEHLFVLTIKDGRAGFTSLKHLPAGESERVPTAAARALTSLEKVSLDLRQSLVDALVRAGLYEREAVAMVNTWKDSWFDEEGLRVLYVMPRRWTDITLPLKLDPAPRELVRVMVGRAEVISPGLQQRLTDALVKAVDGDAAAETEAVAIFRKLGRFGQPALWLSCRTAPQAVQQNAHSLLSKAHKLNQDSLALSR